MVRSNVVFSTRSRTCLLKVSFRQSCLNLTDVSSRLNKKGNRRGLRPGMVPFFGCMGS